MTSRILRTASRRIALAAAVLACTLTTPRSADAQQGGRISGRIVDAESGLGLTDVGVQVVGTTRGVMSGVDGRYVITGVPTGTVTLQARRIGYAPKTVTGIMLPSDGAIEQNIALETATVQLQAQVVTASAESGTVTAALDQQRSASGIVSSITSEQIARSPDSDAAQAV